MGPFPQTLSGIYPTGYPGSYPLPGVPAGPPGTAYNEASKAQDFDQRGSAVRSFFPETWLWEIVPLVTSHSIKLERKLPDTITNWVTNVFCVSSEYGIGLSDILETNAFKPFFVDVFTPYSVKRNTEIVHLPVKVFNYLNHNLEVRISLKETEGITLDDVEKHNNQILLIGAEDSYTHYYRLKATKLGRLNLTVEAFPIYSREVGQTYYRDVVVKELLVEPEGYPRNVFKSILLCGNDAHATEKIEWDINLPKNTISDSSSGSIKINSDILGPVFQNLDNVLQIPTGCGEQIMAKLSPNLYVLKYLKANNALTDDIKERILNNLEIGYQQILSYKLWDGSFAAFSGFGMGGSTYLTAFVLRTLSQMQPYISIDKGVLISALQWITKQQLQDGCFNTGQHVFHNMGNARSGVTLTAYVLISILESNLEIEERAMFKAKMCLLRDNSDDQYSLATRLYAFSLMNATTKRNRILEKLTSKAKTKNDLRWWEASGYHSSSIEISSYVAMALLESGTTEDITTAASIVRWLQTEMGPQGGFYTTVDTVTALDAISRFAVTVNKEPNLNVSLGINSYKRDILISQRNKYKTEEISIDEFPSTITAKVTGTGCVSVQVAITYYVKEITRSSGFKLDIKLKSAGALNTCSLVELKPCISYTGPQEPNMVIAEIKMPSGYVAEQLSLYEVLHSKVIKKFEETANGVVFYFTKLDNRGLCVPFRIKENLIVENRGNATIKIYDYYDPITSISKSFNINNCVRFSAA